MYCKNKCNFKCPCNLRNVILIINNICDKKCHYCIQTHDNKKTIIDKEIIDFVFNRNDIDVITVMGGEFNLLPYNEKLYIYNKMLNSNVFSGITTNSLDIFYPGIIFNRHIISFNETIRSDYKYNIVLNNKELEEIHEFLKLYNHIKFKISYNRTENINNKKLLLSILNLSNIEMIGYGIIKSILCSNSSDSIKDKLIMLSINKVFNSICDCNIIKAYKYI